jgi:hypothetical protein
MRVVITATAVFDFPEDVEIQENMGEDGTLLPLIVMKDRRFRPFIDFDLAEDDDDEGSGDELDEIYEIIDESLDSEQYTVIDLDGGVEAE